MLQRAIKLHGFGAHEDLEQRTEKRKKSSDTLGGTTLEGSGGVSDAVFRFGEVEPNGQDQGFRFGEHVKKPSPWADGGFFANMT